MINGNKEFHISFSKLIIFCGFTLILFIWFATFLTELGIFNYFYLSFFPLLIITFTIFFLLKHNVSFNINKQELLVLFSIILITCFIGIFHHHPIDGGRDNGVYISTSIHLAKDGALIIPDEYVNTYPGYYNLNDKLIPHFSPAYTAWLASSYLLFKVEGIYFANTILVLSFLLIFYILVKDEFQLGTKMALMAVILYSTHYLTIWISRTTLNENMFQLIVYFSILLYLRARRLHNLKLLLIGFFCISLSILVRQEAIFYVIIFTIISFLTFHSYWTWQYGKLIKLSFVIIISFIPFVYYIFYYDASFILKIVTHAIEIMGYGIQNLVILDSSPNSIENRNLLFGNYLPIFAIKRFFDYYTIYLLFSFVTIFGEVKTIIRNNNVGISRLILVIVLISPAFFVFINPMNATDLPYFMRRFYVLFPLLLLATIMYIYKLWHSRKKFALLICVILISINLAQSSGTIFFSEYSGVEKQLADFDSVFEKNSNIIFFNSKAVGYDNNPYGFLYNIGIWAPYMHFQHDRKIMIFGMKNINSSVYLQDFLDEDIIYVIAPLSTREHNITDYYYNNTYKSVFADNDLEYIMTFNLTLQQLQRTSLIRYYVDTPGWSPSGVENRIGKTFPDEIKQINYEFNVYKLMVKYNV